MKTQHTPGEWTVRTTQGLPDITIWQSDKECVATVWACSETEANARLIAAAPELLEALNEVRRHYAMDTTEPKFMAPVRIAIAKATE